jgi:hypothetical protein
MVYYAWIDGRGNLSLIGCFDNDKKERREDHPVNRDAYNQQKGDHQDRIFRSQNFRINHPTTLQQPGDARQIDPRAWRCAAYPRIIL